MPGLIDEDRRGCARRSADGEGPARPLGRRRFVGGAALIHRAIGDQLTCVFVDNGLLRLNEATR
jgi:hypothetical protein